MIKNLLASPPQILRIKSVAISSPSLIEFGSIPLSNLNFASVLMLRIRAVFLMDDGKKYADSSKIFLVFNSVDVVKPPIIPPRPKTLF